MNPNNSTGYRSDMNLLRALVVFSVVVYHFNIPPFKGGFIGVDVFFVISGYLMAAIVVGGIDRRKFSLSDFYLSRLRRIFPAMAVMIAGVLTFGWFHFTTLDLQAAGAQGAYSLTFLSNFSFWLSGGYFAPNMKEKVFLHTWSLAVEAQFYLLFPLLIFISLKAFTRDYLWIAIFSVCAISFGLSNYRLETDALAAFYLLPSRAWELLVGSLVFFVTGRFEVKGGRTSNYLVTVGIGLIIGSILFFDQDTSWPGVSAIAPVLGTAMVILGAKKRLGEESLLVKWLGERSYSLYLWHWPIVVFLLYAELSTSIPSILMGVFVSLCLAEASYRYIEKPSREWMAKRSRIPQFAILVSLCLPVTLVSIGLKLFEFSGRVPEEAERAANASLLRYSDKWLCEATVGVADDKWSGCRLGDSEVGLILIGDSHAGSVASAVIEAAKGKGRSVFYRGTYG